jgi:biopolymer transport protein ExbB
MRRTLRIGLLAVIGVLLVAAVPALAQDETGGQTEISYWNWFIVKGGAIGWLLLLINFISWGVIIEHFISIRRATLLPETTQQQVQEMIDAKRYKEVIEYTAAEPSMLSYVIHESLTEAGHGYAAMERAMEEASEERTTKLLRKIELLNVIGNVSPMLGLLGTVFGMILVFSRIVQAGGMPDAAELAGGVGVALVTTFWGLVVAIPALAVFAFMRNRVDALSSEAMMRAQEILAAFRPAAKK